MTSFKVEASPKASLASFPMVAEGQTIGEGLGEASLP